MPRYYIDLTDDFALVVHSKTGSLPCGRVANEILVCDHDGRRRMPPGGKDWSEKMDDRDIPLANKEVHYETLLEDNGYAVSRTTVRAGGETQWHHHTSVSDRFTVVSGVLTVEFKAGDVISKVEVRDYYAVDPGVRHHVKNETDGDVVYIMVQSGGQRDIVLEALETAA